MTSKAVATGGVGGLVALSLAVSTPYIQEFEGRRLIPYYDVVKVLTVCDGHTGKDIVIGKVYTDAECDALTAKEAKFFATGVLQCSPYLAYHPMQLAAMISFAYNLGVATYCKSSIRKLFDQGRFVDACNFLPRYKYAGGKVWTGLVKRRAKEQKLCLSTLTAEGMKNVPKID